MLSNGPLPAETYIPSNIPGPIRPGIGPGSWHVGPKIVREGRLPYGTYSARMARKDATMRTYGDAYGAGALTSAGMGLGVAALFGLLLVPSFVVGPFIVKAFAPEWSYGRRLGASMGFGILAGLALQLVRAAKGKESVETP